jgi:DNA recombination protein RmuC
MSPEIIPYLLLAFVIGLAVGYVLLLQKWRALSKDIATEREHNARLQTENERIAGLDDEIKRLNEVVIRPLESDRARLSEKVEQIPKLETTIKAREQTLVSAQNEINDLRGAKERLEAELKAEQNNFEKLQQARKELADQFEVISRRVLKDDLEEGRMAIGNLISPLGLKIEDFKNVINTVYSTEAAERNSLRGEIKNLVDLNHEISKEASNLASALKRDTKQQGNWGELILEKVLEFSGLRKGEEYKLQVTVKTEDDRSRFPDAIIYLPEKKHIIIDSKVSLIAFERYCSAKSEEERDSALIQHIASVKNHINELSKKDYPSLPALDSPEFTLLFMPIESSFGLAIQADNELFEFAWNRKIVIVSPSTLLATLRTIASIWKQERQTKNALEIADRAGKMYDKFVGFVDDLISVGNKMDDAKKVYEGAMNKLSVGAGNLVRQSEQLKDMGAKATKRLPAKLLDRSIEVSSSAEVLAAGPNLTLLEQD